MNPESVTVTMSFKLVMTVMMVMVVVVTVPPLPFCSARRLHQQRSRASGIRGRGSGRIPAFGAEPVWHSPCISGSGNSEQNVDNEMLERHRLDSSAVDAQPSVPVSDLVHFLVNEARLARQKIEDILSIITGRTRDSYVIAVYEILDTMPGFPPLDHHALERNLTQALPMDYERVSRLAVFLEQAKHDTRPYRRHLSSAFNHVSGVLCWLQQASLALCQPISYDVTRNIMNTELRHLRNSALRDTRNYVIGRDALILLNGMIEYYEGQIARSGNMVGHC